MRLLFTITGQYDFSPVVRKEPTPNPSLTCARVSGTVLLLRMGCLTIILKYRQIDNIPEQSLTHFAEAPFTGGDLIPSLYTGSLHQ